MISGPIPVSMQVDVPYIQPLVIGFEARKPIMSGQGAKPTEHLTVISGFFLLLLQTPLPVGGGGGQDRIGVCPTELYIHNYQHTVHYYAHTHYKVT